MEEYKKIHEEGKFQVGADVPEIMFNSIGKRGVRRLDSVFLKFTLQRNGETGRKFH